MVSLTEGLVEHVYARPGLYVTVKRQDQDLRRAVDPCGDVIDILIQVRREAVAVGSFLP
jgi:transposase-like protein